MKKISIYKCYSVDFTELDGHNPMSVKYANNKAIDVYSKNTEEPIDKTNIIISDSVQHLNVYQVKKEMDKVAFELGCQEKLKELHKSFPELDEEEVKHTKEFKKFKKSLKKQLMDSARNVLKTYDMYLVKEFFDDKSDAIIYGFDNETLITKVNERLNAICKGFSIESNELITCLSPVDITGKVEKVDHNDLVFCGPVEFTASGEGADDIVSIAGVEALQTKEADISFKSHRSIRKVHFINKSYINSNMVSATFNINVDKASIGLKDYHITPEDAKENNAEEMIQVIKSGYEALIKVK